MTTYTPPSIDELITGIDNLPYSGKNPERLESIKLTKTILRFIKHVPSSSSLEIEKEKRRMAVAAYEYGRKLIHLVEYKGSDPSYRVGMITSSGSSLYSLYSEKLKINTTNPLNDHESLIFLIRLYVNLNEETSSKTGTILIDKHRKTLADYLDNKEMSSEIFKKKILELIKSMLQRVDKDLTRCMNLISSERLIDEQLCPNESNEINFYQTYKNAKAQQAKIQENRGYLYRLFDSSENEERKFFAQLAVMVSKILPRDVPDFSSAYTRSHMIKIGMLLFFMRSINSTESVLYKQCAITLNIKDHNDLSQQMQLNCLSAFRSFIKDNSNKGAINKLSNEVFGNENLLNPLDYQLKKKVEEKIGDVIRQVENAYQPTWPVTMTLTALLSFFAGPVGYGVGNFIGYMASTSTGAMKPTFETAKFVNYVGVAILGAPGGVLGGFIASSATEFTLMRLFGKVLEPINIMFAKLTGTVVGMPIDCTWEFFQELLDCALFMREKVDDPDIKKLVDPEYLNSLRLLPREIFSDAQKARTANALEYAQPQSPKESNLLTFMSDKKTKKAASMLTITNTQEEGVLLSKTL